MFENFWKVCIFENIIVLVVLFVFHVINLDFLKFFLMIVYQGFKESISFLDLVVQLFTLLILFLPNQMLFIQSFFYSIFFCLVHGVQIDTHAWNQVVHIMIKLFEDIDSLKTLFFESFYWIELIRNLVCQILKQDTFTFFGSKFIFILG